MNGSRFFRMTAAVAVFFALVVCGFCQQITIPSQAASSVFRSARLLYVPDGQPTPDNLQKAFLMRWIVAAYKQNPLRMEETYDSIRSEFETETGLELGMVQPEEGRVTALSTLKEIVAEKFTLVGIAMDIMDTIDRIQLASKSLRNGLQLLNLRRTGL